MIWKKTLRIIVGAGMLNNVKSFSAKVREEILAQNVNISSKRDFVRMCFLSGGTISDPHRSYHMEFTLNKETANKLMHILKGFDLKPKCEPREKSNRVYVKEKAEIADILNIMSAYKSLFQFENACVEKNLRNNLNRKVNCETANLNKTVSAAMMQIDAIKIIDKKMGLDFLEKPLAEVAQFRLQNENASLEEIGAMLTPPIGKSGVNHRLRKIIEIAQGLKGDGLK